MSELEPAVLEGAPNGPERISERVRTGAVGWGAPLLMAFLRLPLIAVVYFVAFLVWGTGAGLIYRWQRRLPSLIFTHFVVNASFGVLPLVLVLSG